MQQILVCPRGVRWVSAEESFLLGGVVALNLGCCRGQLDVGEAPHLAVGRSSLAFLEKHHPSILFRAHAWWHWAFPEPVASDN